MDNILRKRARPVRATVTRWGSNYRADASPDGQPYRRLASISGLPPNSERRAAESILQQTEKTPVTDARPTSILRL
jgi:hypothetical protein